VLISLSGALAAEGRLDDSRGRLAEAIDSLPADQHHVRPLLVARLAHLDAFRGKPEQARETLLAAVQAEPPPSDESRVTLTAELAFDCWRTGQLTEAVSRARDALHQARAIGTPALTGLASAVLGLAEAHAGPLGDAQHDLEAAEEILARLSDKAVADRLDALLYLAWGNDSLGRHRAVLRDCERALSLSRANDRGYLFEPLTVVLGQACMRLGELDLDRPPFRGHVLS
jgi:tetratricopeptide (TPR) repeat protein